jgi:DNA helicase-2/ATP-dependent DNA helicase PcrA
MDLLADLNPQQKLAVSTPPGPVLVLAGPGSGKTRVLTHRIAYLIGRLGVQPYNILAVTFTNKAAREMQNRVEKLLGGKMQGLWLGTFHAVCARILRREADLLPFKANFVIFDEDDQLALVKRAIRELDLNEKLYRPTSVHSTISKAKNDLLTPESFPATNYREEVVKRVYAHYQDLLIANNAVDFDDLLLDTARLLEENPAVREKYARRFEHILVDEFQDTNQAQYLLLRHLASFHHNLFVVGDEDQSIYRWRGADYRNVLRFEEDYPQGTKVLLEQNYRSTQTVLDAARAVIDRNPNRTPKALFSDRGRGDKIILYEGTDDYAEAAYVVDTIAQAIGARQAQPGDFAIMYRTNAQSRLLEEAFLRAGIAYRLVGAQRFYGRREVKDIISYLRLVYNPDDEASLDRVINVPPRGIGDKTMVALQLRAQQTKQSVGQILIDLANGPDSPHWQAFSGHGAAVLADFAAQLVEWHGIQDSLSLPGLFDRILEDIGYHQYIDDQSEEGHPLRAPEGAGDRWGNVLELRRIAVEYEERGMVDFLENIALVSDQDTLPEAASAPTLLTLHAAKGLEFPQVMIVGLDDGLLPHSRSRDDPEQMAEERRLFYVGLTRAKDRLYLVRAERRGTFGTYEDTIPSSFLADLPDELLSERRERRRSSGFRQRRDENAAWQTREYRSPVPSLYAPARQAPSGTRSSAAPVLTPRYASNMRVRHVVWGEGWVLESRIEDGDETVDVSFDSVGFKRLVASLANLTIVK